MKTSNKSIYITAGASLLTAAVLVIGILVGSLFVAPAMEREVQASTLLQTAGDADLMAAYEQKLVDVYRESLPSVVSIRVTKALDLSDFDLDKTPEDHPEFFNQGGGSGFVWDNQGHILTNNHVIENATDIEVIFADDTRVDATIVGADPDSDLAIIKANVPNGLLQPLPLGDSDNIQVGQLAIAVGNPFGQEFTMTSGIVSGVGRLIRGGNAGFSIPSVIQTDAAINPGNSGGPLLNRQGEVIGINAQMFSRTGSSSGIGFAIPVNIARQVAPSLINGDDYEYAWLGISGGEISAEMAEFRSLDADVRGAVVMGVVENSPAADAGLQGRNASLDEDDDAFRYSGDIIIAIEGQPVSGIDDLITFLVSETQPGDTVTMDVIRADGSAEEVEVTLGARPSTS